MNYDVFEQNGDYVCTVLNLDEDSRLFQLLQLTGFTLCESQEEEEI